MSGGSLDYLFGKLNDGIADIKSEINPNNKAFFENQELMLEFIAHLELVSEALHDIEWELSCDYGDGDSLPAIKKVLGIKCNEDD